MEAANTPLLYVEDHEEFRLIRPCPNGRQLLTVWHVTLRTLPFCRINSAGIRTSA